MNLRTLFEELSSLPETEQNARLDEFRTSHPEIHDELMELLAFHRIAVEADSAGGARGRQASLPCESIGPYVLDEWIGSGGMGAVYRARSERTDEIVAIKLLRPDLDFAVLRARFDREIEALRRLDHPGIAKLLDSGTFQLPGASDPAGTPYLVLEYVSGLPLLDHVEENGLGEADRIGLIIEICRAVEHAHGRGVIHRDLKPQNILVDESGRPKILDFGVARLTRFETAATTLTGSSELLGTPKYMSPEQILAGSTEIDTRSDQYSLALITYEILVGTHPYDLPQEPIGVIRAILDVEPKPISNFDRSLKGPLDTVLLKALEKDPRHRFASVDHFANDLRAFLEGRRISVWGVRIRLRRLRRPWLLPLGVVVLAVVIGIGAWGVGRTDLREGKRLDRVYAQLDLCDELLHGGSRTEDGTHAAVDTLQAVQATLSTIETSRLTDQLQRYVAWRLGEAYYFLGDANNDIGLLTQCERTWASTNIHRWHESGLASMDPSLPLFERIRNFGLVIPRSGNALVRRRMAGFETPERHLRWAAREGTGSLRTLANRGRAAYYDVDVPRHTIVQFRNGLCNVTGSTYAALSDVTGDIALADSAFVFFDLIDDEFRGYWGAYGSYLHNRGVAHRYRGELLASAAEFDSSTVYLTAALEVRTPGASGTAFERTKIEMSKTEVAAGWFLFELGQSREAGSAAASASRHLREAQADLELSFSSHVDSELRQARAEVKHLQAEVALALGDRTSASALLSEALNDLEVAAEHVTRSEFPIPRAVLEFHRGRVLALRSIVEDDRSQSEEAARAFEMGRLLAGGSQNSRLDQRFEDELARLDALRPELRR